MYYYNNKIFFTIRISNLNDCNDHNQLSLHYNLPNIFLSFEVFLLIYSLFLTKYRISCYRISTNPCTLDTLGMNLHIFYLGIKGLRD
ncbi:hypothetical protein RIR_jg40781.t1 [Rhizophagus irregularis DAOM 181602=DAOM 197198]|nr:hypothetical protein RIR_jg40781.t1 [Rhizophagus irregularis DAOM 181602=DAOM 197198]